MKPNKMINKHRKRKENTNFKTRQKTEKTREN